MSDGENLDDMSVAQLEEHLQSRGIAFKSTDRKADLQARARGEEVASDRPANAGDGGSAQVQDKVDQENAQGYRGTVPDPTPNEAYTLKGVTSGMPTPETERGPDRNHQT